MKKAIPSSVNDEREIVALALNEQGYLLHHKLVEVLHSSGKNGRSPHAWYVEATEVPVYVQDGKETRIDVVLRHGPALRSPWRVVLECKRSARDYKRWVFFGQTDRSRGPSPCSYYVELAKLNGTWDQKGEPPMSHHVDSCDASAECPVFDYGVEVRLNRPDRGKRASATDAIEDAFQQVTLGQAGLAIRLLRVHELTFRLLPVVVTTAELMSVHFSSDKVSLDRGMIEPKDLKLEPTQWLAVNYRINDLTCEFSGITTNRTTDLAADLAARQVRTVFVVQAPHIQPFLAWLEKTFPSAEQ